MSVGSEAFGKGCESCVAGCGSAALASLDAPTIALLGNPNTGKTTIFNALTGMRMHVGNWPGKTVARAEGRVCIDDTTFRLVDLPGCYSLFSASHHEEIARDFLLFGRPDVTVVVVDSTRLERNLILALQVLEITPRVVVALNLMDEAKRHGIEIDTNRIAVRLGVPVIPMAARYRKGLKQLLEAVASVCSGEFSLAPHSIEHEEPALESAIARLSGKLHRLFPALPNVRWVAQRLLDRDPSVIRALKDGSLGRIEEMERRTMPLMNGRLEEAVQ